MVEAALDRLLVSLAVRLRSFAVCAISPGWRITFDPVEALTIHYALDGEGSLVVPGHPPLAFAPLTLIIVPAGQHYSIGDPEGRETFKAEAHCRLLGDGLIAFEAGDAPAIRCICGTIVANYPLALGLFETAPGPWPLTSVTNPRPWRPSRSLCVSSQHRAWAPRRLPRR